MANVQSASAGMNLLMLAFIFCCRDWPTTVWERLGIGIMKNLYLLQCLQLIWALRHWWWCCRMLHRQLDDWLVFETCRWQKMWWAQKLLQPKIMLMRLFLWWLHQVFEMLSRTFCKVWVGGPVYCCWYQYEYTTKLVSKLIAWCCWSHKENQSLRWVEFDRMMKAEWLVIIPQEAHVPHIAEEIYPWFWKKPTRLNEVCESNGSWKHRPWTCTRRLPRYCMF